MRKDVLDCGIHSFEDVNLDHKSYVKWVLELGQKEIMNRSETLTETPASGRTGGQKSEQ